MQPGYLAFVRQGALLAAPFDVNGLRLSGAAVGVVDNVMQAVNESHPDWSPDGRWIAYDSDESWRPEVYVQPYPDPGARYVVSRDGGTSPAWARDGRELFYQAPGADRQVAMMSTAVTATPEFATGTPQKLFQGLFVTSGLSRSYDVSPDGRRFIMVQPREQAPLPVAQIVVVQNWVEELKRLAPPK